MPVWTIPDNHKFPLQQPKHPAYKDGCIEIFECNDLNGSEYLVSILDELRLEHAGNSGGEGLFNNRKDIIQAWHEHRLFGLRVYNSDPFYEANKKRGGDDAQFLVSRVGSFVLPVFCAVDKPCLHILDTTIEYLWVAERVRGIGVGTRMVAEINAGSVEDPVLEAQAFWHKMGYVSPGRSLGR